MHLVDRLSSARWSPGQSTSTSPPVCRGVVHLHHHLGTLRSTPRVDQRLGGYAYLVRLCLHRQLRPSGLSTPACRLHHVDPPACQLHLVDSGMSTPARRPSGLSTPPHQLRLRLTPRPIPATSDVDSDSTPDIGSDVDSISQISASFQFIALQSITISKVPQL